MAIVTALLAPIHLFSFSALLGSQLYQTFIVTKVTFQRLPRAPFINLQKYIFPIYFQSQALLLFLSAATLPPYGPLSLIQHKSDWIPFLVSTIVSGLNLVVFGPRTRKLMLHRVEQGIANAKTASPEDSSPVMQILKKRFGTAHAMSIHLNLISLGAHLWYTWRLASRLDTSL
ncbi:hypothetical protein NXS19_008619 [Fusarium pseudograminearum]|uniref:TMEM205-like domain-containing protein n=1 Tax=Fusarium pseudograminearum (strain CS3096) TaxID=1028729 RepID=K3VKB3_FUSPC|nr:hypothetical protein FPSE_04950 [Fusarium pseudograminearum CS3096]EKJ74914.1 hypothetical protein FPSE_04950 [Fusarium pseudograminearum CS3096]UZP40803.1 hypothetical protein NXS19_008619 [Fusarium pseudograminearum]